MPNLSKHTLINTPGCDTLTINRRETGNSVATNGRSGQVSTSTPKNPVASGWTLAQSFKAILRIVAIILAACLLLPCLIPLGNRMIQSFIEATVERKAATHVMAMCRYQPLYPRTKLNPFHAGLCGLGVRDAIGYFVMLKLI